MKNTIKFFIAIVTLVISSFAYAEEISLTQAPSFATLTSRSITIDNKTGQALIISIPTMFGPIPYATNVNVVAQLNSGEKKGDCGNKNRVCYEIPAQSPFAITFYLNFSPNIPYPKPNEALISIFNETYSSSPLPSDSFPNFSAEFGIHDQHQIQGYISHYDAIIPKLELMSSNTSSYVMTRKDTDTSISNFFPNPDKYYFTTITIQPKNN